MMAAEHRSDSGSFLKGLGLWGSPGGDRTYSCVYRVERLYRYPVTDTIGQLHIEMRKEKIAAKTECSDVHSSNEQS